MAVDNQSKNSSDAPKSSGSRVTIGANVTLTVLFVIGIVAVLQMIAYSIPGARFDMTSSRINSLSDGSKNLLSNLDTNVRLTSLYFATDLEDDDQPLYRRTVKDLLSLYESTRRSKVTSDAINPFSDHDKMKDLIVRLRKKQRYDQELKPYQESIEKYKSDVDMRLKDLVHTELETLASTGGAMSDDNSQVAITQIQTLFTRWTTELEAVKDQVNALSGLDNPQEEAAVNVIKSLYREFGKILIDVPRYAMAEVSRNPNLPDDVTHYLRSIGNRFASLAVELEAESTKLQNLEPLKINDLLQQFQNSPNTNALIVETDDDAMVVDFNAIWPVMDQGGRTGRARFQDRAFKGEEQLTSAILRATHKEQTAVVFVRWGGMPLFMGGFVPGQPPAPFTNIKRKLEDVNFIIDEWDLKASATPPDIDPPPTRTIFVVFKPSAPQRGPMGQLSQEPPFSDADREKLFSALGENPRVLFIAGWAPGPFGPIPGTYEYNEYLKETWGIHVDDSSLLIETMNTEPGKYNIARRDFYNMQAKVIEVGDHDIVHGSQASLLSLPWCAPLEIVDSGLEGVEYDWLISIIRSDGIWGIKNIQTYQNQMNEKQFLTLAPGDLEGPFRLSVAASKADAKLVVVSSREFALDQVAFAQMLAQTSRGITLRSRNPGNISLLINSLHWLNDNTQYMNIGKPIDAGVLEIEHKSTVTAVRVITIFVWPALALACGGMTWWIRRR